jgi:CRP/FNR family transcriptional regulator, cyclic AMP receptor protein
MNNMKDLTTFIANHPFLVGMDREHLKVMTQGAKEMDFDPGEILFQEGECANQFFLIEKGTVVLESHLPNQENVRIQTLKSGDVLGWSWLFPPFVWHMQARAIEPTHVIMLNGGHLLVAAEENHHLGYELMKRVSQIVIQRLQAARNQLLQRRNGKTK